MPTTIGLHSRIKGFVEQLAASTDQVRTSRELTDYLSFCARFHNYSFHNTILIFCQRPDATRVAGFQTWKSMGRFVRKGEKGIAILAPIGVKKKDDETDEETIVTRFRTVYVFDLSQTEGEELPEVEVLSHSACAFDLTTALTDFAGAQQIKVETSTLHGSLYGVSKGGTVVISDALEGADRFAVLAHEIAHELLGHKAKHGELDRKTREIEAETAANVVCRYFTVPSAAPNYLALHGANGKEVTDRLSNIVHVVQQIISGIESRLNPRLNAAANS